MGLLENRRTISPTVHSINALHGRKQFISFRCRHEPPKRNNTHSRIGLVAWIHALRAVRTHARRHHKCPGLIRPHHMVSVNIILIEKLIQRHITHSPLLFSPHSRLILSILLPNQRQALVELIDLTLPRNRYFITTTFTLQLMKRFHPSCSKRVQRQHGHEREDQRQPQSKMHGLEHGKVALTNRLRVKLLQRLFQEINRFTFTRILAHLLCSRLEHLLHSLGTFGRLRRVLRDIFYHRPQIQTWSPINIPHVS